MLLPPPCPSAPRRCGRTYLLPLLLLLLQAPDLLQELRPLLPQPHDLLVGVPVFLRASGSRASGHDGAGPFPVTISPLFCPRRGPAPESEATWRRWQLPRCHLRAVQGAPCHQGGKERLRQGTGTPSRPPQPPQNTAQGCFGPPESWWPPHSPQGGQNQRGSPEWAPVEVPCARRAACEHGAKPCREGPGLLPGWGCLGEAGGPSSSSGCCSSLCPPTGLAKTSAETPWQRCYTHGGLPLF